MGLIRLQLPDVHENVFPFLQDLFNMAGHMYYLPSNLQVDVNLLI